jgi:oligosaccharide repeat unit polymerase
MKPQEFTAAPSGGSTLVLIAGVALTNALVVPDEPSAMAQQAALGVGLSLLISFLIDMRRIPRNLVRADIMALGALYFLTLFEFLFPQPAFNTLVNAEEAGLAIKACLVAFVGLALGRHCVPPPPQSLTRTLKTDFPPKMLLTLFWIAIVSGYYYQLLAVQFNVFEWFDYLMAPRFSQPWSRGRLGDWKALLGEIGMILNLAPPIAGIILARRADYSRQTVRTVLVALLFTFFYAFASGTRNLLFTFITTFTVAFAFTLDRIKKKELLLVTGLSVAVMLSATVFMLKFRNIGFSNYLNGYYVEVKEDSTTMFVDYNLYVIAKLTDVFPAKHDYLGLEIPYISLIRPIPRALWAGKPEGLSLGIEDALGVEGLTLASSFVGEAYISGGLMGVVLTAIVLGAIMGWWNHFGNPQNSPFGHLVFSSGFFAAVISMRSMLVFTTAILPTIAALILGHWLLSQRPRRRPSA